MNHYSCTTCNGPANCIHLVNLFDRIWYRATDLPAVGAYTNVAFSCGFCAIGLAGQILPSSFRPMKCINCAGTGDINTYQAFKDDVTELLTSVGFEYFYLDRPVPNPFRLYDMNGTILAASYDLRKIVGWTRWPGPAAPTPLPEGALRCGCNHCVRL